MPMPSLKRQAPSTDDEAPPKKRQQSTLGFDSGMNLIRRTVTGVVIPLQQGLNLPMEEEEFVDAPEEQGYGRQGVETARVLQESADMAALDGGDEVTAADRDTIMGATSDCEEVEDDDDLFTSTFGKAQPIVMHEDDQDSDYNEELRVVPQPDVPTGTDCVQMPDHESAEEEHAGDCDGTRGASTPPASPQHSVTKNRSQSSAVKSAVAELQVGSKETDLVKDYSRLYNFHKKWHDKAYQFIPRIELAAHRYWICVLDIDRKPRNASQEKHFTWMKGNRVTSMATVWYTYQELTMREDFVLLLGREKVEMEELCQELDYFGDKFICLRAVASDEEEAKGQGISDELVPVVVDLIDDD